MSTTTTPPRPLMSVRIDAELKAALERAARDDERSLSSLVTKVLRDWVQARAPRAHKRGAA